MFRHQRFISTSESIQLKRNPGLLLQSNPSLLRTTEDTRTTTLDTRWIRRDPQVYYRPITVTPDEAVSLADRSASTHHVPQRWLRSRPVEFVYLPFLSLPTDGEFKFFIKSADDKVSIHHYSVACNGMSYMGRRPALLYGNSMSKQQRMKFYPDLVQLPERNPLAALEDRKRFTVDERTERTETISSSCRFVSQLFEGEYARHMALAPNQVLLKVNFQVSLDSRLVYVPFCIQEVPDFSPLKKRWMMVDMSCGSVTRVELSWLSWIRGQVLDRLSVDPLKTLRLGVARKCPLVSMWTNADRQLECEAESKEWQQKEKERLNQLNRVEQLRQEMKRKRMLHEKNMVAFMDQQRREAASDKNQREEPQLQNNEQEEAVEIKRQLLERLRQSMQTKRQRTETTSPTEDDPSEPPLQIQKRVEHPDVYGYYAFMELKGREALASADEIRAAFRTLSKRYHPDFQWGPEDKQDTTRLFQQLNEAYHVLSHRERRAAYDQLKPKEAKK